MSAWMITDDHADFLATAYVQLVDDAADPQEVALDLLRENMFSLQERYDEPLDDERLATYQYREWPGELDLGWVNKNAACADYQCCEHGSWGATQSCHRLVRLIEVSGGEGKYPDSAPWGIDSEHRPAAPLPPLASEQSPGMVRMILIDPVAKEIAEGWLETGLASLYATLGCHCIDIVRVGKDPMGRSTDMIVDDNGRLTTGQSCFRMGNHLIAGRALLAGSDDQGEMISTALHLSEVKRQVQWVAPSIDYTPPEPVIMAFDNYDDLLRRMAR